MRSVWKSLAVAVLLLSCRTAQDASALPTVTDADTAQDTLLSYCGQIEALQDKLPTPLREENETQMTAADVRGNCEIIEAPGFPAERLSIVEAAPDRHAQYLNTQRRECVRIYRERFDGCKV